MTGGHDRRYRGDKSYPFPVWNGIFEHTRKIGEAIWVFLWLINAVTREKNGAGLVYSGAPVKIPRIAKDLGFSYHTVERHLEILEAGGYIARRRTPYGCVIRVCKSLKFGIWSKCKRSSTDGKSLSKISTEQNLRDLPRTANRFATDGKNKEDAVILQVQQKEESREPACGKPQPLEMPPQTARRYPPPVEIESEGKTLARLIICAKEIRKEEERSGRVMDSPSFRDKLKWVAATHDIAYTSDLCAQAEKITDSRNAARNREVKYG